MSEQEIVLVDKEDLHKLIKRKVMKAGLPEDHAQELANHLTYADSRGVHSHGAVRVEYYSERISKGGSNVKPDFSFKKTGPCTGIYEGDNAIGMVVAKNGMLEAIQMAKENGIGLVGMRNLGHCGTLSYFLRMATEENMIAMSMCQSDPMVVPYGSADPYFGTNPIGFAVPCAGHAPIVFDMATTVGAWGKILDSRAKNKAIPETWAVDKEGHPTTDPFAVGGLLAIAGPKGYGLMMMVDILCGSLLGVPFGQHVSSMYADLSAGRGLGQIHLVINPDYFSSAEALKNNVRKMVDELHGLRPAAGFDKVMVPGESSEDKAEAYEKNGIPIVKEIYDYLVSDDVHYNRYDGKSAFASEK
ncbi:ureidoglycolate dehydrogenase [Anaerosinus massiliensis]|uniref:ureidoglycolate dehydrogenase n=1 Tax=Massilibacillus massiliensis TaxID=1806837 RepID=UPI000AD6C28E|nr:ureidoglycolate dehydrogenase [Massilibacillus massiliensis]